MHACLNYEIEFFNNTKWWNYPKLKYGENKCLAQC